jgi:hypothetical protein
MLIAAAALIAVACSVGCYTLLKHPRLHTEEEAVSPYEIDHVTFAENCGSCHDAATLTYHHRAVPLPGEFVSPRWDYYFEYPWWLPYYASPNTPSEEEEQKQRPFDRRHLRPPDETNPAQLSAEPPSSTPPPPAAIAKPADSGNTPPADTPKDQDANKRDERRSGESQSKDRRTRKP